MGTKHIPDEELIGDDQEMMNEMQDAQIVMQTGSLLRELADKLDAWGHTEEAAQCREQAKRLLSGEP